MDDLDLARKTLKDFALEFGGVLEAFFAAMIGTMPRDEAQVFEVRFFTRERCYRAAVLGLRLRYGSVRRAVELYRAGKFSGPDAADQSVQTLIETYVLYPSGPFHIHMMIDEVTEATEV